MRNQHARRDRASAIGEATDRNDANGVDLPGQADDGRSKEGAPTSQPLGGCGPESAPFHCGGEQVSGCGGDGVTGAAVDVVGLRAAAEGHRVAKARYHAAVKREAGLVERLRMLQARVARVEAVLARPRPSFSSSSSSEEGRGL